VYRSVQRLRLLPGNRLRSLTTADLFFQSSPGGAELPGYGSEGNSDCRSRWIQQVGRLGLRFPKTAFPDDGRRRSLPPHLLGAMEAVGPSSECSGASGVAVPATASGWWPVRRQTGPRCLGSAPPEPWGAELQQSDWPRRIKRPATMELIAPGPSDRGAGMASFQSPGLGGTHNRECKPRRALCISRLYKEGRECRAV
jgi:hypothetical protein